MYRVRATRECPGEFRLCFGRGGKKLTDKALRQDDGQWMTEGGRIRRPTLRGLKEAWEQEAITRYGTDDPVHTDPAPATVIPVQDKHQQHERGGSGDVPGRATAAYFAYETLKSVERWAREHGEDMSRPPWDDVVADLNGYRQSQQTEN